MNTENKDKRTAGNAQRGNRGDRAYRERTNGSGNPSEKPRRDARPQYDGKRRGPDRETDARYENSRQTPENAVDEGLVIGRNAVRELLRGERSVDKLLVQKGNREGSIVELVARAVDMGIPVVETDKERLDFMAGPVPHQGVIAMAALKEYSTVEDILKLAESRNEPPFLVLADGITDPNNLGALIRCAEGCGVHGIVIPKRRAVGLTASVAKASAGALEHMMVAKVANMAATVDMLKSRNVWCYAVEVGGKPYYEADMRGPCALVLGSEGEGVSKIVLKNCDGIITIPMYGLVNSFNVSTAAAVVLAEAARQNKAGQ